MRRTLATGLLSLTLAGCGPITSATPMAVTTTAAPATTVSLVTTPTPTPTPAVVSPVDLPPPAIGYVGLVTVGRGPAVPVTVQRGKLVLLPGSRQIRAAVSRDFGACDTFLSASASGRWLAYTTVAGDLHVIDLRTRNEYSLGPGCDPAWGPGDRLAYLVATTASLVNNTYRSAIVVRKAPLSSGTVWARGELWGLTWAADRLLYSRSRATFPHEQLVVASSPRAARLVPRPAAGHNDPLLIAASPDGRRLVVQVDRSSGGNNRTYEDLVDSATGKVLSELVPKGFQGLAPGVWVGDRVVAPQGGALGGSSHPQPELIRLGTSGDKLRVLQVRDEHAGDDLADVHDIGGDRVAVTHYSGKSSTLLSCRVSTLTCSVVLSLS